MPRTLLLGPILNRNRDELIARCRDLLRQGRGREFLYLAASKPLLDKVTLAVLGGETPGSIEPLGVHLLSGFSRRVLAGARYDDTGEPLPYFQPVDRELRPLQRPLLARVIAGLAESGELRSFGPLAKTGGVVASVADLIGEIQRAGKTADEFRAIVERRAALEAESKPARREPELPPESDGDDEETKARRREAERIAALDYDRDTALVYETYSGLLDRHNLTDASRDYLRALDVLRGEFRGRPVRVPFLDEVRLLVVDGFFDLVPVHGETLAALFKRVPETIVNLNWDESNEDAFEPFRDVVSRFEAGEGCERVYVPDHEPVAAELAVLRSRLFKADREPDVPAEPHSIQCLAAPDRVREVRAVAKQIKSLVLEDGIAPDEICVVMRSRDRYEPLVRDVFADEEIATTLDRRCALGDVPAVRAALKVLDAAASNRSREGRQIRAGRLAALLKTDYVALAGPAALPAGPQPGLPFDAEDEEPLHPDDVENAAAFVGIELHLDDWLRRAHRLLERSSRDDRSRSLAALRDIDEAGDGGSEEALGTVTADRRRGRVRDDYPAGKLRMAAATLERLGTVLGAIPHQAPAREMAEAYRSALDALQLADRLEELAAAAFPREADMLRAALDLRGYEALDRAITAVVDASELAAGVTGAGSDSVGLLTRSEFRSDLVRAVDAVELSLTSPVDGGVRVLTATDMRGLSFDTVFVLGLVEGEFPARARGDWIYPQHERQTFKEMGLPLEDLTPSDVLRKEEHYFYQAACRARRSLVLCRPLAGDDEADAGASYFITEIETVLGRRFGCVPAPSGFDGETLVDASTPGELARALARAMAGGAPGPERPHPAIVAALAELAAEERPGGVAIVSESARRRIAVERLRDGHEFSVYDGVIESEDLRELLTRAYARHFFSASELNAYGHCAFRFFAERVLGLSPRVEAALDLQALDEGVLLHEALRRFFARFAPSLPSMSDEAAVAALREAAGEVFDHFERGMPPLNQRLWEIEKQTLLLMLERFVLDELGRQRTMPPEAPRPSHFELAFGMRRVDADPRSTEQPLVLERERDGEREAAWFQGQIDRVDLSDDGALVTYDYKRGLGPGKSDMEQGRDVQMALYLAALEQVFGFDPTRIAGGGYYALKIVADRRKHGLYRADMKQLTGVESRSCAFPPDDWRELRERIIDGVWQKLDGIRAGAFPVSPSQGVQTCSACDFPKVCRYDRYRIAGKRPRGAGADA